MLRFVDCCCSLNLILHYPKRDDKAERFSSLAKTLSEFQIRFLAAPSLHPFFTWASSLSKLAVERGSLISQRFLWVLNSWVAKASCTNCWSFESLSFKSQPRLSRVRDYLVSGEFPTNFIPFSDVKKKFNVISHRRRFHLIDHVYFSSRTADSRCFGFSDKKHFQRSRFNLLRFIEHGLKANVADEMFYFIAKHCWRRPSSKKPFYSLIFYSRHLPRACESTIPKWLYILFA